MVIVVQVMIKVVMMVGKICNDNGGTSNGDEGYHGWFWEWR